MTATHFTSKSWREKTFPKDIERRTSEIIEITEDDNRPDATYKKIREK